MCDVPSIAVFCSESIECFPDTASKFFLKFLVTIPVAFIIIIIIIIVVVIIVVVIVFVIIVVVVFHVYSGYRTNKYTAIQYVSSYIINCQHVSVIVRVRVYINYSIGRFQSDILCSCLRTVCILA